MLRFQKEKMIKKFNFELVQSQSPKNDHFKQTMPQAKQPSQTPQYPKQDTQTAFNFNFTTPKAVREPNFLLTPDVIEEEVESVNPKLEPERSNSPDRSAL